ncbi:MAG: 4-(cytidine 5'-diphospho)-2-C-methyl-D-erythritol kinase [Rhodospirillaceae bacterium]|jgi:4-diphosphocytidyl-2-C-methyl-D-erythritol kinase|nr:4-(cytidine 5'-diphospho)-2-C-methyl-D-erythritol kinase [Rhodospirillaceae bacterium]MBT5565350.1 4-(cytidine 5'-diphospho)-2-C-methyl-D-erythritol kinase [Rhodospirillaceae bacterium]MBT6089089.1 4-(cytidine 5'-diphospho)-2-C-methyl-D-erythritol kinase [Rhodospirillaceae bacterium]MBT6961003.1 4-(cytidine 5'-diphospho)-2-C-methyl-D-erythritol kinase [Rhodospirillaceae bacterium]
MTAALTLAAAAKINLTLHITGRRDDGYHNLDSLIGFTDVADVLTFRAADTTTLRVTGAEAAGIDAADDNLVVRAARLMQTHLGVSAGMDIELEKNIPVAAGLGGGSADAAATVAGCMALWGSSTSDLISDQTLASDLGADVPVCRYGRAARISGIGETITPTPNWPTAWLVLANPRIPLSTADVFRAFDGKFAAAGDTTFDGADYSSFTAYIAERENCLTSTALAIAPIIGDVLDGLGALSGCSLARMSGSGPTCFGLFGTKEEADVGQQDLSQTHPDWWVRASPLVIGSPS